MYQTRKYFIDGPLKGETLECSRKDCLSLGVAYSCTHTGNKYIVTARKKILK